jgi:polyisoprenoid-binding protein YceI
MFSRRKLLIGGGVVVALAVVLSAAAVIWYARSSDDAPERVSLSEAVSSVGGAPQTTAPATTAPTTSAPATSDASPTSPPAAAPAAAPSVAQPEDLAGTWALAPNSESFVGYRVKEELARIGSATAVGRTNAITATLQFDGSAIRDVRVTADLRTLRSDNNLRDGQLRTQALETNRFPAATFVLAEPIRLEAVPAEGVPVDATAVGDLTLHGVTRRVSIDLQGQRTRGLVVVVGSLEIRFADYGIAPPRAASVLSVEDRGILELQLVFQRQSQS